LPDRYGGVRLGALLGARAASDKVTRFA
jgi:hypothetical protein